MRRPLFPSKEIALTIGLGGFVLAWVALYDAFEARGQDTPRVLRPFTWW